MSFRPSPLLIQRLLCWKIGTSFGSNLFGTSLQLTRSFFRHFQVALTNIIGAALDFLPDRFPSYHISVVADDDEGQDWAAAPSVQKPTSVSYNTSSPGSGIVYNSGYLPPTGRVCSMT